MWSMRDKFIVVFTGGFLLRAGERFYGQIASAKKRGISSANMLSNLDGELMIRSEKHC